MTSDEIISKITELEKNKKENEINLTVNKLNMLAEHDKQLKEIRLQCSHKYNSFFVCDVCGKNKYYN